MPEKDQPTKKRQDAPVALPTSKKEEPNFFALKSQLATGQKESLNKIRGLRKDLQRIHTAIREKDLDILPHREPDRRGPDLQIAIDSSLTKKQIATALNAVADFYRDLGGSELILSIEE